MKGKESRGLMAFKRPLVIGFFLSYLSEIHPPVYAEHIPIIPDITIFAATYES